MSSSYSRINFGSQYKSGISRRPFLLAMIFAILSYGQINAQISPPVGLRENKAGVYAFINAKIVQTPVKTIGKGTLVIRDGIIESVGTSIRPPADATIIDLKGLTLYPGLIESYSNIGLPEKKKDSKSKKNGGGAKHWNENVTPEFLSSGIFKPDSKTSEKYRKLGFTTALIVPRDGIFKRGKRACESR